MSRFVCLDCGFKRNNCESVSDHCDRENHHFVDGKWGIELETLVYNSNGVPLGHITEYRNSN